ncbi:Translation initiation factor eIF-2B subunit alpha [Fasciola hepatica]|uniref:Translation initiation factor eIF2B subunit alpha n=1 Tax=Fasciola hepatica TaxID=6192 RepID=A0A4E0RY12_FASHE|nr:Translation initiation factor eIF-2B subunit alpha [Fasciola hepatica]
MKPNASAARQFERLSRADLDKSEAIIAVEILARVIKECDVSTVQGLHGVLNKTISDMSETTENNPSVKSACELFQRFITLPIADAPDDFNHCKQILQDRATIFLEKVDGCKQRIAENFANLLPDGARILVHSFSRVVLTALCHAEKSKSGSFGIHCYVTTGAPNFSGPKMTRALARSKIPCTLVPDLSIAYLMPQVDLVILGARAVVESGGILNDMGTSTVAMIATSFGKPVYVLAESYKFIRIYPLDQRHIPTEFKGSFGLSPPCSPMHTVQLRTESDDAEDFPEMHTAWTQVNSHRAPVVERTMPSVDYTNPCYITYLVTDLGVLTPSVVSDELIKLYL